MKNLRVNIDKWFERLDDRWSALPLKKQRKYTLYFFLAYMTLTVGVIFKVWYDAQNSDDGIHIDHIENPVLKIKESKSGLSDSSSNILNNKKYERK